MHEMRFKCLTNYQIRAPLTLTDPSCLVHADSLPNIFSATVAVQKMEMWRGRRVAQWVMILNDGRFYHHSDD